MSVVESPREHLLSNGSWSVDLAHSALEFRVEHMLIETVHGRFRDFEGWIVGGEDPSVAGTINVASLETLSGEHDAYLRSPNIFDAERFPEIRFESAGMHFDRDGRHFALPGELTIKGVTRPILLAGELRRSAADDKSGERLALALRGQLDRADYGLVRNHMLEAGEVFVDVAVDLILDVTAVRAD